MYLLDPLIATGGTASAALQMLVDWGMPGASGHGSVVASALTDRFPVNKIKLLCVLASQTGLDRVRSEYPELEVRHR